MEQYGLVSLREIKKWEKKTKEVKKWALKCDITEAQDYDSRILFDPSQSSSRYYLRQPPGHLHYPPDICIHYDLNVQTKNSCLLDLHNKQSSITVVFADFILGFLYFFDLFELHFNTNKSTEVFARGGRSWSNKLLWTATSRVIICHMGCGDSTWWFSRAKSGST